MGRSEAAEFTVMCMVYDDGGNILVQERLDPDWPGITFPGGHVERGEAFADAVTREVLEETGLVIEAPRLCGVKQFQTKDDARYVVLFYKTDRFSGTPTDSDEGRVFWLPRAALHEHTLAHDFARMLEVFERDDLSECCYQRRDDGWQLRLL